jgi:hypothetical protein
MLKILSFIVMLTIVNIASAQKVEESKVPAAVTKVFKAKYPNVKDADWEKEGADYEVEYLMATKKYESKFSADGKWMETETKMKVTEIPQSVKTGWAKTEYKDWKIEKVSQVESSDATMSSFYELEVEKAGKEKEVCVSSDGKVLKTEDLKK